MSGIRHGGDQEERRRTGLLRKGEEGHYRWETYLPEDVPKRWLNMGTALREDMRGEGDAGMEGELRGTVDGVGSGRRVGEPEGGPEAEGRGRRGAGGAHFVCAACLQTDEPTSKKGPGKPRPR